MKHKTGVLWNEDTELLTEHGMSQIFWSFHDQFGRSQMDDNYATNINF